MAPRPARGPTPQPLALSPTERAEVLGLLYERFVDQAPASIYATLLDEGRYLCSVPTMYRLPRAGGEVHERRRQATHPPTVKPELVTSGPNQVWSWDITKLLGPVKWTSYDLSVILDLFSRYAPGWLLATRESAELAERLLGETIRKHGIGPDQLTVHADRGTSMASKPVALLLADLGVTKSHPRPHCSNDNPYSEAQFKTLKYRPEFPDRFGSIEDARPSAARSSAGTTPSTATRVLASTPRPTSTSAAPSSSNSSAPVCSRRPTPAIPSGSSAGRRPRPPSQDLPGSTNLWRSPQRNSSPADRSHRG